MVDPDDQRDGLQDEHDPKTNGNGVRAPNQRHTHRLQAVPERVQQELKFGRPADFCQAAPDYQGPRNRQLLSNHESLQDSKTAANLL